MTAPTQTTDSPIIDRLYCDTDFHFVIKVIGFDEKWVFFKRPNGYNGTMTYSQFLKYCFPIEEQIKMFPAPAPAANAQPTQTINLDSQVLDQMRKEYERGRAANSPFPRYHGTFENFVEQCLLDYMQFAWN